MALIAQSWSLVLDKGAAKKPGMQLMCSGGQARLNIRIEMALIAQSWSLVLDKGGAKSQGCN
jgi:hypothetical protein